MRGFSASTVQVLRQYAQNEPALFISLYVGYTFPGANYAGALYPYRWRHLLPIPGLYHDFVPGQDGRAFHRPEEMGPIERDFYESFIDDAVKHIRCTPSLLALGTAFAQSCLPIRTCSCISVRGRALPT